MIKIFRYIFILFAVILIKYQCKSQDIEIKDKDYVTRKTCIEIFTGTWCAPCRFSHINFKYNILPYIENYTIVEYHLGSPDPFDTWEGQKREWYYNLSNVPEYVFDGTVENPSVSKFEEHQEQKSYLKIEINNAFHTDSEVYVSGKITPLKNFPVSKYSLRTIVIENENTHHISNWDTAYYSIANKQSPSEVGTQINTPKKGIPIYFNQKIPIYLNIIQNIDNLKIVLLVQNDGNSHIGQSEWKNISENSSIAYPNTYLPEVKLFPNPTDESLIVQNCGKNAKLHLYNSFGQECSFEQNNYEESIILNVRLLSQGIYYLAINDKKICQFTKID